MYNQKVKNHCRTKVLRHAIKSLTTERSTSVCVERDHVRRAWEKLNKTEEAQKFFQPFSNKMVDEIEKWEEFHDSTVKTKKPSDLRVCYLCGDNPINDLEVLVENGVLCQNVWAVEKDGKVLEKALENVSKSHMRNIRIFKGDLIRFLEDVNGQFDIIYFDACGTLPSAKQKTLKTIGVIFLRHKLASPGALITNFSFPPEEKCEAVSDEAKDSQVSERGSFVHLINEYLQHRDHYGSSDEISAAEIDSQSIDEKYSDYITSQVIDCACCFIPAYNIISSDKQSSWDQLFVNRKDFLSGVKEADWSEALEAQPLLKKHGVYDKQAIHGTSLHHLSTAIENCKSKSCLPCKTWVNEIFPNWKSSEMKKEKLFCLILTHLLSHSAAFIQVFGNKDLKEICHKGYENFLKISPCDSSCPEDFSSLIGGILYGQMACPSFPVINKLLRLKYTAKTRQMFCDVFIFDQCRYLYENFPSIHCAKFAITEPWQQMLFRIVADGLQKHLAFVHKDVFSNVASVDAQIPGQADFTAGSHSYVPDRQVLNLEYFMETGNKFAIEGKFAAALVLEEAPRSSHGCTCSQNCRGITCNYGVYLTVKMAISLLNVRYICCEI